MATNTNNIVSIDAGTTEIFTDSYAELTAAGGTPIPTSKLVIMNGTSSIIKLAIGASGSETDLVAIASGSQVVVDLGSVMAQGTRLSVEAIDADATAKYFVVSLMP